MPAAGTLSKFYVSLSGTAGSSSSRGYDFTVRKNGSNPTSGLTVSIRSSATSGSDTSHTVSFAAGDTIDIRVAPTTSSPNTVTMTWSALFTP